MGWLHAIDAMHTSDSTSAITGVTGYSGARYGRARSGAIIRSRSTAADDSTYSVSAPNTDNRMMSDVRPVNRAIRPTTRFASSAATGVLVFGWIVPSTAGT